MLGRLNKFKKIIDFNCFCVVLVDIIDVVWLLKYWVINLLFVNIWLFFMLLKEILYRFI